MINKQKTDYKRPPDIGTPPSKCTEMNPICYDVLMLIKNQ